MKQIYFVMKFHEYDVNDVGLTLGPWVNLYSQNKFAREFCGFNREKKKK